MSYELKNQSGQNIKKPYKRLIYFIGLILLCKNSNSKPFVQTIQIHTSWINLVRKLIPIKINIIREVKHKT